MLATATFEKWSFIYATGVTKNTQPQKYQSPNTQKKVNIPSQANPAIENCALKFLIDGDNWFTATFPDSRSCRSANIILVGDGEKVEYYKGLLKKNYKQLELSILCKSTGTIQVDLSDQCKSTILNLVLNGKPSNNYRCEEFVKDTEGLYSHETQSFKQACNWNYTPIYDKSSVINYYNILQTGDKIIMRDANGNSIHFAIYIERLFISVFGQGPIYVTTLEEMLKIYPLVTTAGKITLLNPEFRGIDKPKVRQI